MKTLSSFLITALILALSTTTMSPTVRAQSPEHGQDLSQRMDSLEVKLEKLIIEQADTSPFATGETLDWGKGWSFGTDLSGPNQISIELRRIFGLHNWHAPWEPEYIDKRRGYRIGAGVGLQTFRSEGLLHKDNGDPYYPSGEAYYLKLIYGSPVLLNFLSTSGFLKAMCIVPRLDEDDSRKKEALAGLGLGADIEFWIARNKCITLGFKTEGQLNKMFESREWDDDIVLPFELRPQAGVRVFF